MRTQYGNKNTEDTKMTNRINKIAIMETLKKYLDDQLAWKIFDDM